MAQQQDYGAEAQKYIDAIDAGNATQKLFDQLFAMIKDDPEGYVQICAAIQKNENKQSGWNFYSVGDRNRDGIADYMIIPAEAAASSDTVQPMGFILDSKVGAIMRPVQSQYGLAQEARYFRDFWNASKKNALVAREFDEEMKSFAALPREFKSRVLKDLRQLSKEGKAEPELIQKFETLAQSEERPDADYGIAREQPKLKEPALEKAGPDSLIREFRFPSGTRTEKDSLGRISKVSYPNGRVIELDYNARGDVRRYRDSDGLELTRHPRGGWNSNCSCIESFSSVRVSDSGLSLKWAPGTVMTETQLSKLATDIVESEKAAMEMQKPAQIQWIRPEERLFSAQQQQSILDISAKISNLLARTSNTHVGHAEAFQNIQQELKNLYRIGGHAAVRLANQFVANHQTHTGAQAWLGEMSFYTDENGQVWTELYYGNEFRKENVHRAWVKLSN